MTRRSLALAVLSGLLLAVSFPSAELPALAWIALVPLFVALQRQPVRTGFLLSGVTGIVFFGCTLYWIAYALNRHGPFHAVPAGLIAMLLCAVLAIFFALFGAVAVHVQERSPGLFFAAAPAAWVALELARTHLFTGFPWLLLGYSQYRVLPLIQVADLTGVYGMSFLIVLVNAAVSVLLQDRKRFLPALVAAAVTGAVFAYGMLRIGQPDGRGSFRVSVIQGNIEQDRKWDPTYQNEVIAVYKRLTLRALQEKPDLIIWPETALPFYFGGDSRSDGELTRDLKDYVRSMEAPLLAGSALRDDVDRRQVLRNAAVFLKKEGDVDDYYVKHRLVPFGEYVPLKNGLFFFMEKLVRPAGEFVPGRDHTVVGIRSGMDDRNVTVSTVICYEIIFPGHVSRFVNDGAAVITTITNDAWFGRTSAPYQHFSMAVLRAVENRVPIARAANTGVSGFIDAKGRVLDTTGIFTEAHLTRTLTPGTRKTFYTRYGDVFAWLCVVGSVVAILPRRKEALNLLGA